MHLLDFAIVVLYFFLLIGIGLYFYKRQASVEEYFVSDRKMGTTHIGLSVVATDVGGGFSIGLGGLGFMMGLSGSWLLFTGLVGAWLSAIVLIPVVKKLGDRHGWTTYPDFLEHRYGGTVRVVAAAVSALGYAGFVGAQILAGAKLASVALEVDLFTAVWIMAGATIIYTTLGGLKAVVYTDTIQWIVLLFGLLFLALPFAYFDVGGLATIRSSLPESYLSFTAATPMQILTWSLTIIPIWFVGMTLYQRIYATRDIKTARRAWFVAGLLEYPLMAFAGAALGTIARVKFPEVEPEMGIPLLISDVLPIGVMGCVMAAYLSAIMSTADSCLLASVGNLMGDFYQRYRGQHATPKSLLSMSRTLSLGIGLLATLVALYLPNVLELVMLAYAFMVSGLFAPTIIGLIGQWGTKRAALWSILAGGTLAVVLNFVPEAAPGGEPVLIALPVSVAVMLSFSLLPRVWARISTQ